MRYANVFFLTIAVTASCFGQDFKSEFDKAFQKNDTVQQQKILQQWEKADPSNAELFTRYFNYFFYKSRKEGVSISEGRPKGEVLEITDSTGAVKGYMGSKFIYDAHTLAKAFEKIDKGISIYPDRLDMWFGKIHVLGVVGNWNDFTSEIVKVIQRSSKNSNHWMWTNNELQKDGEDFFLSSLQDYQLDLYNTGDDALLKNMRTIANEVLKFYPNHVESLSNLAITHMLIGEFDPALEALLRAEKIAPKDPIILSNIAQAYKLKGDRAKAIEYYEKTIKFADPDAVEYAREQIKLLKK